MRCPWNFGLSRTRFSLGNISGESILKSTGYIVVYYAGDSSELREHSRRCYRRVFPDPEMLPGRSRTRI